MKLKNAALQELYETIVNGTFSFSPYAECPIDKAFRKCDERVSESATFAYIKELQNRIDIFKKDLDEAKSSVEYFRASRDDWRSRAKHEEEEKIEQVKRADILASQRDMLKKELDEAKEKNRELKKDRDIWFRKNGEKQAEIAELKKQLGELTSQYQKLTIENKRLRNNVRAGYDQGQTDLWVKLQDVKDMQPNEFDVECECLGDVIDMDLEDFLDTYKKWWEEKETDRMRNWLADFCVGRVCTGCPLGSHEYKCGRGYSFKRRDRFDLRVIPDEDIKKYYEKANGCGRYSFVKPDDPCSGVREKIKEACDAFSEGLKAGLASEVKEVPVSCDIPIKDLASWGCTIEGKFEINKDILEKVCGIKPDEEDHELEYGDAVRLPWRDYDYMYIGPEEKHIRLFNPKNHTVVCVSPTDKLTYQGCKIVLCDEDDLKKIWEHKK